MGGIWIGTIWQDLGLANNNKDAIETDRYVADMVEFDAAMLYKEGLLDSVLDKVIELAYVRVDELKDSFESYYGYPWGEDAPEEEDEDEY